MSFGDQANNLRGSPQGRSKQGSMASRMVSIRKAEPTALAVNSVRVRDSNRTKRDEDLGQTSTVML